MFKTEIYPVGYLYNNNKKKKKSNMFENNSRKT